MAKGTPAPVSVLSSAVGSVTAGASTLLGAANPGGKATDYKPISATPPAGTSAAPTAGATPVTSGATGPGSGVDPNAFAQLQATFDSYGLSSLVPDIKNYLQQGYTNDTISLLLQQTDAYKQRFAGNTLRAKNGLAVLSPADYLSLEAS